VLARSGQSKNYKVADSSPAAGGNSGGSRFCACCPTNHSSRRLLSPAGAGVWQTLAHFSLFVFSSATLDSARLSPISIPALRALTCRTQDCLTHGKRPRALHVKHVVVFVCCPESRDRAFRYQLDTVRIPDLTTPQEDQPPVSPVLGRTSRTVVTW